MMKISNKNLTDILKLLDGSLHLHLVANVQVGEEFGHGPWEHTNFDNLRRQQTWLATFRQTHTSRSLPTTHRLRTISPLTSHALADLPTKWVCTDARRTCRLRRRARGPGQRWTTASGAHVTCQWRPNRPAKRGSHSKRQAC